MILKSQKVGGMMKMPFRFPREFRVTTNSVLFVVALNSWGLFDVTLKLIRQVEAFQKS